MKRLMVISALMLALLAPCPVQAASWRQFTELQERYYHLDNKKYRGIVCQVEVSLVRDIVEQIKEQLAPLEEKIEITEDLSQFNMLYTPGKGLSFIQPDLDIRLTTVDGVADPWGVRYAIDETKAGFQQQIDSIIEYTRGIFDEYTTPQQEDYEDLMVDHADGMAMARYRKDGSGFLEEHQGVSVEIQQDEQGNEIFFNKRYEQTVDGKLLLMSKSAVTDLPAITLKTDTTIQYQDVGHVVFPGRIQTRFEQTTKSAVQKDLLDIQFINCTIR